MFTEDGHTHACASAHTHTPQAAFSLVFLFSPCIPSIRLGIIMIALLAWLCSSPDWSGCRQLRKILCYYTAEQMRMSKKGLFTLTRKQREETERIRPWETCRRGLIRSCANPPPTLRTNSELICLNDMEENVSWGREKKKEKEFLLWHT